ncbi:MFS transporter [Pseudomonas sp. GD04058]|uniref:MFS transporter n=1 Tax=Pseudomonas sp. GD04058 TaxID=2975429 RepID=UPI0024498351|nr:MFS transporter [Pseudomonas sp. GD04058]MDG9882428.1 MFS transporter [Pseudomonas sp. GD04058]
MHAHIPRVGREGTVLVLGSSLTIMGAVMVAPILPRLAAEFGPVTAHAEALVPLAITGPALAIALCAPLAGWIADRVGRKALLIVATVLYALFGVLPALLDDLPSIVASRLLFGCAEAAIMTCCAALIADYWKGEQRLRMINYQVVSIGLVGALFFVIGGAAGEHGWRTPFYLYLLPLLLVPAMLRWLWEPQRQAHAGPDDPARSAIPSIALGYLLIFFGMALNFIVPVQAPALLVSIGVNSSTLIGLAAGLGLLASLAGSLLWPLVRSYLGIRGGNALLLVLLAAGLWWLGAARSYADVLWAVLIHGVGAGLLVPNAMAPVMNALSARARGRGLGGFTACLYLGQFASPLLVMALGADLRGALHWLAFASLAGALAWGLGATLTRSDASSTAQ